MDAWAARFGSGEEVFKAASEGDSATIQALLGDPLVVELTIAGAVGGAAATAAVGRRRYIPGAGGVAAASPVGTAQLPRRQSRRRSAKR